MTRGQRLLLVSSDQDTVSAVSHALEANERLGRDDVCHDLLELRSRLERGSVPGVLVDIDGRPARMLADLESIITRFGDTRFVLLSREQRSELLLEAMHIGARHVLDKRAIGTELLSILDRVIPTGATGGASSGAMFTVLGAGGGCGATTVCVNLAHELVDLSAANCLLVDLDFDYGAMAAYLGVEARYGLADVLADPSRIDAQLVRSSAELSADGLHLLANPAGTGKPLFQSPSDDDLVGALGACCGAFRFTVVDAPRVSMETAGWLAQASARTLIVMQLTVKDLRYARYLAAGLSERGVSSEQVLLVANRYRRRYSMISLSEAEQALGDGRLTPLRNDYSAASKSVNFGRPLGVVARRSPLRKDLRQLSTRILESASVSGQAVAKR